MGESDRGVLPGCLGEPPRLSPPAALAELGERESPVSDVRCLSRLGRLGRLGPEPPQTSQTSEAPQLVTAQPRTLSLSRTLSRRHKLRGKVLKTRRVARSLWAAGYRPRGWPATVAARAAVRALPRAGACSRLPGSGARGGGCSRAGSLAEARARIMRSAIGTGACDCVTGAQGCWCSVCGRERHALLLSDR